MLLGIKVIVRDPSNKNKFLGKVMNVDLKKILKIKNTKTILQKKTKRRFTTLVSPHVHKDSQTSFRLAYYNYLLQIKAHDSFKVLTYFKKMCTKLIPDIKIKITFKILKKNEFMETKSIIKKIQKPKQEQHIAKYITELSFLGKKLLHVHR